jgi:hypothetical protein
MTSHGAVRRLWSAMICCAVEAKVLEDRRFNSSSLSLRFKETSGTVTDPLDFRKLCSHWVPKMLSEEHKKKRAASALTFLTRYSEQGDGFLSQIVTGDETWVSHLTVHGVEAHFVAEKAQIQADHFNPQDHVHSFFFFFFFFFLQ